MPGSSSWMPYAPQGVKGFEDDDDDGAATISCLGKKIVKLKTKQKKKLSSLRS